MLAHGLGVRTGSRAEDGGGGKACPSAHPPSRSHDDNGNQLLLFPNLFPWFPPRLPVKAVTLLA